MPRGRAGAIRLMLNYLSFALLSCGTALFRLRGKFDVIFVFEVSPITVGIPAIFIKKLKKAPIAFWVLDLWPDSLMEAGPVKNRSIISMVGRLVRFIYRHCDLILVQSRGFLSHVMEYGAAQERVKYFPSWAEDVYQTGNAELEGMDLPSGFRVMFAGNIGVAQDFDTILDVADLLRNKHDIHWLIVGDGRRLEWVREQVAIREMEKTVHLLGRHPVEKMPAFYAAADVMLVSLKRAPILAMTIPGKVQSYLASGRPIVAMLDGEGARIVSESGAGISCPAENADALAQAIIAMYEKTREEREEMGRKGKQYCEMYFSREVLFKQLETWMKELSSVQKQ